MNVAYDLISISSPGFWDHATSVVFLAVCGFFGYRLLTRKWISKLRSQRIAQIYIGCFLLLLCLSFSVGEIQLLIRYDQRKYQSWLEREQYEVTTGVIEDLVLNQTFWASEPASTFVVDGVKFEFGDFSRNATLRSTKEAGPLREGREVTIWHREELVLRLFTDD